MRKKRVNGMFRLVLGVLVSILLWIDNAVVAEADTYTEMMSQFPGVTVSDSGEGWTTDYKVQAAERHKDQYTVYTGATPSPKATPGPGEHYYEDEPTGTIPIDKWTIFHPPAQCIHDPNWPLDEFYGFTFHTDICGSEYSSGWFAHCADCNEYLPFLVYSRESTVENITFIPADSAYAYMCPFCDNMEQGLHYKHMCNSFISKNRYDIVYAANYPEDSPRKAGRMSNTKHMVDNAAMYEGEPASDIGYTDTHLRKNSYIAEGYIFAGWNTERDGSDTSYTDEQVISLCPAENRAFVVLYAQWEKMESTLAIATGGGSYTGYTGPMTRGYGSTWTFEESKVVPPTGYSVTFNHMGGSGTPVIVSTKEFDGYSISTPTHGLLVGDEYTFKGNNTTDTITIIYKQNDITLPSSTRSGYSFGGWYADAACTIPVGTSGTRYTPIGDITLYAKWVSLILTSTDDYDSNGGKGAVDLTWSQPDGSDKTYQIFQYSELDATHKLINSATDIGTTNSVNKSFAYSGASKTYTVPYSGYYTLTLTGAQGGNYSTYTGGLGGRTTATMYLKAGEVLTYNIGSQAGYNGGGTATSFGNGGGYSSVSSNIKGTLLIAGGGGGAGAQSNGYAGGVATSVIEGNTGQEGMAGGGGGYQGGTAGEYIVHNHTEDCMQEEALDYVWYTNDGSGTPSYLSEDAAVYYGKDYSNAIWHSDRSSGYGWAKHFINASGYLFSDIYFRVGLYQEKSAGKYHYIPTNGNKQVYICATLDLTEKRVSEWNQDNTKLVVYDQNNQVIYSKSMAEMEFADLEDEDDPGQYPWLLNAGFYGYANATTTGMANIRHDEYVVTGYAAWNDTIDLPEGTTGIRIDWDCVTKYGSKHINAYMRHIAFKGGVKETPICGYEEGQVISSKGAYGGSNYINTAWCQSHNSESGVKTGDGAFSIVSTSLGFNDSTTLNDVVATDYAAPDAISPKSIKKTALSKTSVRVAFEEPKDNGTKYYHYVKSYKAVNNAYSLTSNTTLNTLVSGVVKYHYVYDSSPCTTVTKVHRSTTSSYIDVTFPSMGTRKYLHIAAMDKTGNISVTAHIPILSPAEDDSIQFHPKPVTEQIGLTVGDGVASGPDVRTYYVRSDGTTEIEFTDNTYLEDDGSRVVAQVDTVRLNVCDDIFGIVEWTEGTVPRALDAGTYNWGNADLETGAEGEERMMLSSVGATRYGTSSLVVFYKYTISEAYDGELFYVYPSAYTTYKNKLFCSADTADRNNGLFLICDGTPPEITGLDALKEWNALDMVEESKTFILTASDGISGLREFEVIVENEDNFITKRIRDDADGAKDGNITITVPKYQEGSTEAMEFCGSFTVTARAVDNVGNEQVVSSDATALALEAKLRRILEPHEPAFKRGESGVLTITSWGYVEQVMVEFPEELVDLNRNYDYSGRLRYVQEETQEFMIPLTIPDGEYQVKVTGYKTGTNLEEKPIFLTFTVEGSVLDELRTRLR